GHQRFAVLGQLPRRPGDDLQVRSELEFAGDVCRVWLLRFFPHASCSCRKPKLTIALTISSKPILGCQPRTAPCRSRRLSTSAAGQFVHDGVQVLGEVLFAELLDVASDLVRIELRLLEPTDGFGNGLGLRL